MAVLHCKPKLVESVSVAAGENVTGFFDDSYALCSYHEVRTMYPCAHSSYLCFYISCINVIVEDAVHTAIVEDAVYTARVRLFNHHEISRGSRPVTHFSDPLH